MSIASRLIPLFAVTALVAGCSSRATPPPPGPPEVAVLTLQPKSVKLVTELPGRTSPLRIAEVRPQVGGIILQRLFSEGAEVKAGQALYQIDPAPYRATLASAEAQQRSAEANLVSAKLLVERLTPLNEAKLVSRQDFDNATVALHQAEASLDVAKAAVESARINLGFTRVTSPIAGRISRSLVTEGALVTANQTDALATVQQLDPIYVDVTQSSMDLLRLQRDLAAGRLQKAGPGQAKVSLRMEDGSEYAAEGTLQFTEVTVDQGTGSVLLRAVFPNPNRELLPGMFVRAVLPQAVNAAALLVPQAGVSRNAQGEATVLLVDDKGLVSERVINVDRVIDNQWLVTAGLAAGDRVIVDGLQKARPGITVHTVPAKG